MTASQRAALRTGELIEVYLSTKKVYRKAFIVSFDPISASLLVRFPAGVLHNLNVDADKWRTPRLLSARVTSGGKPRLITYRSGTATTGKRVRRPSLRAAAVGVATHATRRLALWRKVSRTPARARRTATVARTADSVRSQMNPESQLGAEMDTRTKAAVAVVALAATHWLLEEAWRDSLEMPARTRAESCMAHVASMMEDKRWEDGDHVRRALAAGHHAALVDASWVQGDRRAMARAFDNYAAWDPSITDDEWEIESEVLALLRGAIATGKDDTRAGQVLPSVLRCAAAIAVAAGDALRAPM